MRQLHIVAFQRSSAHFGALITDECGQVDEKTPIVDVGLEKHGLQRRDDGFFVMEQSPTLINSGSLCHIVPVFFCLLPGIFGGLLS